MVVKLLGDFNIFRNQFAKNLKSFPFYQKMRFRMIQPIINVVPNTAGRNRKC